MQTGVHQCVQQITCLSNDDRHLSVVHAKDCHFPIDRSHFRAKAWQGLRSLGQ